MIEISQAIVADQSQSVLFQWCWSQHVLHVMQSIHTIEFHLTCYWMN